MDAKPPTMTDYLAGRGLTAKTVTRFRLEQATYFDGRPCIKCPTVGKGGKQAARAKFIDGQEPKIKWFGTTPQKEEFTYYSPGGLVAAIEAAGGVLHWCSGEPDVWTLYETGIENATCCFGEGSVPETVADDLQAFGVKHVICWPDLDTAGMRGAYKLADRLAGSGIKFEARIIPGEMESKRDLNQMLQDMLFDAGALREALRECPVKNYNDLKQYAPPVKPAPQPTPGTNGLFAGDIFHEWIDKIIAALGQPHIRDGNIGRWHCPLPGHADKHPSFRIADGDTCKMPICTCDIQTRYPKASEVWDEVARALHCDTWAEYKVRAKAEGRYTPPPPSSNGASHELDIQPAAPLVEHSADEPLFMTSTEAYDLIGNQLAGLEISEMDFVINPLTVLHKYGGFAHIMFPGKLVYIVGISGGGKTSLAEFIGMQMRKDNLDYIWYGPEWTPEEMAMRDLQRAGGVPMIRMAQHKIGVLEERRGVAVGQRVAQKLTDHVAKDSIIKLNVMLSWQGRAHFTTPRMNKLPLSQMLNSAGLYVDELRAKGRKVAAFFFDYLQRANKPGRDGAFWSEAVAGEIKAFCEDKQLVGIVLIQPRKNDSEGVHSGSKSLTEASGQGISDQQCNLYLAIEPVYEEDEPTGFARIKIVKNSMGETGAVTVPVDFSRLTWVDKVVQTKVVNLND